jgi:phenylpropionate dioxygenase-like ring-hydroxylating dioxygenase large terminal subunit
MTAKSDFRETRYSFQPYPNGWFRVAYSHELEPGEVKTLQVFGQELVLMRTEGGEARVFEPHCPHLGAHLGYGGKVEGEELRCPFHHWKFGADGKCTEIPYSKRIPPKARLTSWPLVEKNGLVLVYHDREGRAPEWEPPDLDEIGHPEWRAPELMLWKVKARWLDMNENCVDQAHFKYIHGALSIPPTTARVEDGYIHIAESVFRMRVPGGEADAKLVTLDYGPGFQVVRMTGLIDTLLMNTATPIDANETDVSFAYTVRDEGDARKGHLAEAVIKDLKQQFEHDLPIWENKAAWDRPVLCEGDGPISHYRKWYAQFA